MSGTFLKRIVMYRESDVDDYKIFPSRELHKSDSPFVFKFGEQIKINEVLKDISYKFEGKDRKFDDFEKLLA